MQSYTSSMSSNLRQRQPKGKAARVAEYIKGEVPVPQGRPAGNMLHKDDRQLAAIVLSVIQAAWFITISVGIIFYAGRCPDSIYPILAQGHCCTAKLQISAAMHAVMRAVELQKKPQRTLCLPQH